MKSYPLKSARVLVVYNDVSSIKPGAADSISEEAVLHEVDAVMAALAEIGCHANSLPVNDLKETFAKIDNLHPDVIMNLCEGFQGRSGLEMNIASLWELAKIPYTGNTPLTLGLAQNKILAKRLFESKRIPTPAYQVYRAVPESTYLEYPLIAKPSCEDASLGIMQNAVIHNIDELKERVASLLARYKQSVLVEQYIDGREFNISLLENGSPHVLAISEIDFSGLQAGASRITSYEAKWLPQHILYQMTPAVCPAKIDDQLKARLEDLAIQVFRLLMGRDYGRVDVRVDSQSKIYVLEYNPNPDISLDAGFAKAVKAAGLAYRDFVEIIIHKALKRKSNGSYQENAA
jgi:D-alanine-D-alanine ligase